jgi:electron transport complex protein RnfC
MHVHDGKELTKDRAVKAATVPPLVIVPLSQHLGAPCEAIVKKKDAVKRGQPVGEAKGFVSSPVHSPVSGVVRDVVAAPHASGGKVQSVLIENDGKDDPFPGVDEETDPGGLSREQMIERVRAAGIVGLGGATFPAHVKLSPPKDKPIDTVIVNGAECEPLLTCDYRLMVESSETVVRGGDLVRRIVGAKSLILATEDNKADVAELLRKTIADLRIPDARVMVARTKYPQGGERQLIQALLGREVPTPRRRGLPMDVGVIVQNVGTCHAIYMAISRNVPLIERLVTVVGDAVAEPGNFRVRIGTPVRSLLETTGFRTDPQAILLGGPMMGAAVYTPEVPVTKGTSGILVLSSVIDAEPRDCIRCGSCVKVCPARLTPLDLSLADEAKRYDLAEAWHIDDCIECGCCSYICPARRPIVQQIRHAKAALRKARSAAKAG